MEIHLKINDVVGMDDEKRHIIRVDTEEIRRMLKDRKLWEPLLEDNEIRNTIYMQEKARREAKAEKRERHRQFEIEAQRRRDQHKASIATRKALDFFHDILGIEETNHPYD